MAAFDRRYIRVSARALYTFIPGGIIHAGAGCGPSGRPVKRTGGGVARGFVALWFSLRASRLVVRVLIFSRRGTDACLLSVSRRSKFQALGRAFSVCSSASLDKLFCVGHPRMSRDRPDSAAS